jgi:transcriptional regulator with XRE-family HTH domain
MPAPASRLKTANNLYNQLGERVKECRKAVSITQEDLCTRLTTLTGGVWTPEFREISRLERGERMVTDLEILALAEAIDCSPCYLLTGEQHDTPPVVSLQDGETDPSG